MDDKEFTTPKIPTSLDELSFSAQQNSEMAVDGHFIAPPSIWYMYDVGTNRTVFTVTGECEHMSGAKAQALAWLQRTLNALSYPRQAGGMYSPLWMLCANTVADNPEPTLPPSAPIAIRFGQVLQVLDSCITVAMRSYYYQMLALELGVEKANEVVGREALAKMQEALTPIFTELCKMFKEGGPKVVDMFTVGGATGGDFDLAESD